MQQDILQKKLLEDLKKLRLVAKLSKWPIEKDFENDSELYLDGYKFKHYEGLINFVHVYLRYPSFESKRYKSQGFGKDYGRRYEEEVHGAYAIYDHRKGPGYGYGYNPSYRQQQKRSDNFKYYGRRYGFGYGYSYSYCHLDFASGEDYEKGGGYGCDYKTRIVLEYPYVQLEEDENIDSHRNGRGHGNGNGKSYGNGKSNGKGYSHSYGYEDGYIYNEGRFYKDKY